MKQEQAETIALEALTLIAGDEDQLGALCAQTGTNINNLKTGASDPTFLGAVIDFLLEDDKRLINICQSLELQPEKMMSVRHALPGATSGIWS